MTRPTLGAEPSALDEAEVRHRLGARIRELRGERGLSQEALAARAGDITYKHVGQVERGESNPSATALVRIARGLGVTVGELFGTITPDPALTRVPRRTITIVRESIRSLNAMLDELASPPEPPTESPPYRLPKSKGPRKPR